MQRLAGQKCVCPISGNTQYEAGLEGDGRVRLSWTERGSSSTGFGRVTGRGFIVQGSDVEVARLGFLGIKPLDE